MAETVGTDRLAGTAAGAAPTAPAKRHVFEHLGQPPYKYRGHDRLTYQACPGAPIQPGGSCDHCGTAIIEAFFFISADGKFFKVGNVCVGKSGDRGLVRIVSDEIAKANKAKRESAATARRERLTAALADPETRAKLAAAPHPYGYTDRKTGAPLSLLDWATWMLANAGDSGRQRVEKALKAALA